jgi:hypothetical protein
MLDTKKNKSKKITQSVASLSTSKKFDVEIVANIKIILSFKSKIILDIQNKQLK